MATNVEVKAVLRDRVGTEAWATARCRSGPDVLEQEDVFFPCEGARLKLRILGPKRGELIRYQRTNVAEVRTSRYQLARTNDPEALREILGTTLGTAGIVRKTRLLFIVGQTRVHIDRVEGLGDFLELEVVMRPEQSEQEGKQIAEGLLSELGIGKSELLAQAYIDMLKAK